MAPPYDGRQMCQPESVTVLVDEPRWWWRGLRWCHMASDSDLDELHAVAEAAGISRRAFQGDHYDVPEDLQPRVIALGAELVPSRELVRRLRASGLRWSAAERRAAHQDSHGSAAPSTARGISGP